MNKPHQPHPLILASRSPRRRELLKQAGYSFEVCPASQEAEAADNAAQRETPDELVARLAVQKAADVAAGIAKGVVIGCDTVAECDGHILGKPTDVHDARRMLRLLRGRRHRVLSGLCVWRRPSARYSVQVDVTQLEMDDLDDASLDEYLAGGGWRGKAGAFGYQDRLGWVHVCQGSESNVVGLPLELLERMLAELP